MRISTLLTRLLLALTILATLWLSRSVYLNPPDLTYLRDYYDHSQWRIPLSPRILSDNELYQVAADHILRTGELFTVNPEVPPAVKYFYALAIATTGNPYHASLVFYLAALGLTWYLTLTLSQSSEKADQVTLLLALSAMFFSQAWQTMLDLPQLVFLLAHMIAVLKLTKPLSRWPHLGWLLTAGLSLGLFAGSKFPLLAPLLIVSDAYLLLLPPTKLLWKRFFAVLGLGGLIYLLLFIPFFLHQPDLIAWLRTQWWMVRFYLDSQGSAIPGIALITTLTGWYTGWWQQPWRFVYEWNVLWAGSLFAVLFFLFKNLKKLLQPGPELYLASVFAGQLALYTLLPFWPRYFLLLLPLGIYFVIKYAGRWFWLLVGLTLSQSLWFLLPPPTRHLGLLEQHLEAGTYQELYAHTTLPQSTAERQAFWHLLATYDTVLEVSQRQVEIGEIPYTWPWQSRVEVPITIASQTLAGPVVTQPTITLIRDVPEWNIIWQYEYLQPGLRAGDQLELTLDQAVLGTVYSQDGLPLTQVADRQLVRVMPDLITDPTLLEQLASAISGSNYPKLEAQLYAVKPGHLAIPVGFLTAPTAATQSPAVQLEARPGLELTGKYDLNLTQILSRHPQLTPWPRATLLLKHLDGSSSSVEFDNSVPPQDVTLDQTRADLL